MLTSSIKEDVYSIFTNTERQTPTKITKIIQKIKQLTTKQNLTIKKATTRI